MKKKFKNYVLICTTFGLMMTNISFGQNTDTMKHNHKAKDHVWTQDEADVKAKVEQFLIVAGNYNLDAMAEMMANKANLGITRLKDEKWTTETMLVEDYFVAAKNRINQPYYEPVNQYTIHVSEGRLAFVQADAILHNFGVPIKHNIDYFTLIKENDDWKFVNISFTSTRIAAIDMIYDPMIFAKSYAQAWCSQNPKFVALFFAEEASLSINNGDAAVGRTAIAKDAKAFMDAFPDDMKVGFDSLVKTPKGIEFHWTLTGTNTGSNGTGKKINISGFELWQLDDKGLIKESKGSFDSEEYNRQLKYGAED
tara:strand:+ start:1650 stop:2579 length:930 start_codon:yes stop_codon:yes gene_type:complete